MLCIFSKIPPLGRMRVLKAATILIFKIKFGSFGPSKGSRGSLDRVERTCISPLCSWLSQVWGAVPGPTLLLTARGQFSGQGHWAELFSGSRFPRL